MRWKESEESQNEEDNGMQKDPAAIRPLNYMTPLALRWEP